MQTYLFASGRCTIITVGTSVGNDLILFEKSVRSEIKQKKRWSSISKTVLVKLSDEERKTLHILSGQKKIVD